MKDNLTQNPKIMSENVTEFCKEYMKENMTIQPCQEQILLNCKKWRRTILKFGRNRK